MMTLPKSSRGWPLKLGSVRLHYESQKIARFLFSRVNKLAKLRENKNLANKTGSTVVY